MNMKLKKAITNINKFFSNNYTYLFSFFIPFIILILIFKESNIYPFNDYSYLYGDLCQQYFPLLKGLRDKLINHTSFNYTWDIGLGTGYRAIYAYYLASPLNLFTILINPKYLVDYLDLLIITKLSLCGVSFNFYIKNKYKDKSMLVPVFSICYALSSYMCTYCFNIIWLDSLILFPPIILGLEKLYKEKKYKLYFFSLFFAILSNYYIAIIICIFSIIYFIYMIIFDEHRKKTIEILGRIKLFIIYSILAGTATFIVTLPALFALSNSSSGDISFPKTLKFYNSLFDLMIRFLIRAPKNVTDNFPNLYCSVIILLIFPMYLFNKRFSLKTKIKDISLILFMLLSFNLNVLDYIWHGLHFPNCLVARNSFIYIFLALTIAYKTVANIKNIKGHYFIMSVLMAIIYILIIWKFQINNPDSTVAYKDVITYLSSFFVICYTCIFLLLRGLDKHINFIYFFLLLIVSYELYMNAGAYIGSTHTRSALIDDYTKTSSMVNTIKEQDAQFYRIEKNDFTTYNAGNLFNYNSASIFSSTTNKNIVNFYKALGLEISTNVYNYAGNTPITDSLFSIKYIIDKSNESGYYKNEWTFPLGFMIDSTLENSINLNDSDPFNNLNNIYSILANDTNKMFKPIPVQKHAKEKTFTVNEDGDVYIKCNLSPYSLNVNITKPDGSTNSNTFTYLIESYISYLGHLSSGDKVTIKILDDDPKFDNYTIYAYSSNNELIKNCYNNLKNGFLHIDNYTDTSISGTIDAGDGGLMFTSIPADNGWTAYVDGKKTNIHAFKDAFISLKLSKGKHSIELKYKTPGGTLGMIISLISVTLFISLEIINHRRSKTAELS